jgi:hypothetical protein
MVIRLVPPSSSLLSSLLSLLFRGDAHTNPLNVPEDGWLDGNLLEPRSGAATSVLGIVVALPIVSIFAPRNCSWIRRRRRRMRRKEPSLEAPIREGKGGSTSAPRKAMKGEILRPKMRLHLRWWWPEGAAVGRRGEVSLAEEDAAGGIAAAEPPPPGG